MSWTDPRNMFGLPDVKAEGNAINTIADTWKYRSVDRYVDPYREQFERIEYILKRTVTDYDELVNQFNAIKDIERSNRE